MNYEEIADLVGTALTKSDYGLLIEYARRKEPRIIVEIGASKGCSSLALGQIAKEFGGHLYSIERKPKQFWYDRMQMCGISDCTTLVRAASPFVDMSFLRGHRIDFCFIDGTHTHEAVRADYELMLRHMAPDGLIAFHDIGYLPIKPAIAEILKEGKVKELKRVACRRKGVLITEVI